MSDGPHQGVRTGSAVGGESVEVLVVATDEQGVAVWAEHGLGVHPLSCGETPEHSVEDTFGRLESVHRVVVGRDEQDRPVLCTITTTTTTTTTTHQQRRTRHQHTHARQSVGHGPSHTPGVHFLLFFSHCDLSSAISAGATQEGSSSPCPG